jgi:feruloyl esterase
VNRQSILQRARQDTAFIQTEMNELEEIKMKRTLWFAFMVLGLLFVALTTLTTTPAHSAPLAQATPSAAAAACAKLKELKLPDTTITTAEYINPIQELPGVTIRGVWASPASAHGTTTVGDPFCRVVGVTAPAMGFEVWLPPADKWNGKFNGVGNGALAGGFNYRAMTAPLALGYAVGSTDGGHKSPSATDGAWMVGHPELWDDFGYRAVHAMTRNAKAVIEAYYGKPAKYSYFTGCSGGGQQGLAEAQKYPADYNGIVSGAPANFPTRMWPGETYVGWVALKNGTQQSLGGPPGPPTVTPKLKMINEAAIAACDGLDGAKDGLITDPRKCKFDPATIQCAANATDTSKCLTAEVDTVKKFYEGLKNPTTGELFWPGYEIGSEDQWAGHIYPFVIPVGYFRAMVTGNPDWKYESFDFTNPKDFALLVDADARYGPHLNATDPDLMAFKALGGKLILWHGWADQNIAPRNTINYYNSVVADQGSEAETQKFLRLFMVPGVGHCSGGAGPDTVNWLAALEQLVEKGTAPAQIPASKVISGKTTFTRPLCVYPQVEVYKGSGDINDAANFTCSAPK